MHKRYAGYHPDPPGGGIASALAAPGRIRYPFNNNNAREEGATIYLQGVFRVAETAPSLLPLHELTPYEQCA